MEHFIVEGTTERMVASRAFFREGAFLPQPLPVIFVGSNNISHTHTHKNLTFKMCVALT